MTTFTLSVLLPPLVLTCSGGDPPAVDRLDPADSSGVFELAVEPTICLDCLHAERVTILGDTVGPGYVEVTQRVIRDSVGRYWLNQDDRLKLFNGDGTYAGEVGRPGKGPMEFSYPVPIYTDGVGNVHVIDLDNARETVIGPRLEDVRESTLPRNGYIKRPRPLPGRDRYVANIWIRTADRIGLPLHVISGDSIVVSFGADSTAAEALNEFTALRLLATDEAGRVFSARRFDYDIEAWTGTGRRIVEFDGPRLNEKEAGAGAVNFTDNPLANEIRDMRSDGPGRLWILSWQVRPDWRSHFVEHVFPDGMVRLQFKDGSGPDSVFFSRIDVIDLHRGALIARLDRDGLLTGFVGRRLVFENRFLPDGTPRIVIWRIRGEVRGP